MASLHGSLDIEPVWGLLAEILGTGSKHEKIYK